LVVDDLVAQIAREVVTEPCPHLVAERRFVGGVVEIHGAGSSQARRRRSDGSTPAPAGASLTRSPAAARTPGIPARAAARRPGTSGRRIADPRSARRREALPA